MGRDKNSDAPAANKPPTVSFLDYLPNNYIETTKDVNEGVPHYDDAIGRNFHELSAAGRVATMLQYLAIIVAVIAIVTSRALVGAEVAFTVNDPTYEDYIKLEENKDVLNLQCSTSNTSLLYREFAQITYEQNQLCAIVAADLERPKMYSDAGSVPREYIGSQSSTCKSSDRTEYVCRTIKNNCERGKSQVDGLVERLLSASLALPNLASRDFLSQTLNIQTNLTVQASLDSYRDSSNAVMEWAAENMPVLYGFMQAHLNAIQALRLQDGNDATLKTTTDTDSLLYTECQRASTGSCDLSDIGNGVCNSACDVPECLYDGSDCVNYNQLFREGPNVNTIDNWNYNNNNNEWELTVTRKFLGYLALSLGNQADTNAAYSIGVDSALHSVLSNPLNYFVPFDEDTCANSATWGKLRTTNMTQSQVAEQTDWANYAWYEALFVNDGVPVPSNKPEGDPPYATTMTFACDRLTNLLANAGYTDFTAERMLEWVDHYEAMCTTLLDECPDFSSCAKTQLLKIADASEQEFFQQIKIGAIVNLAIENSGSLADLALDASLKKNSSGFAISPTVDHEKYFEYSKVTSCQYTKKLKPEPGALTTVILGVIGGIVNLSTYIGVGYYMFCKKRILKRDAAMHGSAA